MPGKSDLSLKSYKKDHIILETRQKLGLTQVQFSSLFGLSPGYISLAESKKRYLSGKAGLLLVKMYLQFQELEKGIQADYRSLETRLYLNDIYKKQLPEMKDREKQCRLAMKELVKQREGMKQLASDKENAIIVFTTAIRDLTEKEANPDPAGKTQKIIDGLQLFKQQAYEQLLYCWEPQQAKLQAKIEALAGEAKALKRFRLKIIKEQDPFKKGKP